MHHVRYMASHAHWVVKINGALNHVGFRASHAPYMVRGGEGGIRTHVPCFIGNPVSQLCHCERPTGARQSHSGNMGLLRRFTPRNDNSYIASVFVRVRSNFFPIRFHSPNSQTPNSLLLFSLLNAFNPIQVRTEYLWDNDAPVCLLVVFQNSHQGSSDSQAGTIQGMDIFGLRFS